LLASPIGVTHPDRVLTVVHEPEPEVCIIVPAGGDVNFWAKCPQVRKRYRSTLSMGVEG
jgi:hypothetical protein